MARIAIQIPVTTMGYTGQRDAWEAFQKMYRVEYDGIHIRLIPPSSSYGSMIQFSEAELKQALDFIRDNNLDDEELSDPKRAYSV